MSDPRDEALDKIGEAIACYMNDDIVMGEVLRVAVEALDAYEGSPRRRKVVQLALTPRFAVTLCDDGTMWAAEQTDLGESASWRKLRDVPQDEAVEDTYRMIAHHRARLLSAVMQFVKGWENRPEMQYDEDFAALKAALDGEEG